MCSSLENTLGELNAKKPHITQVYLRSDEAGCYHNSSLIAAARSVGERVGVDVCRYDFSEPQYGKDVCDRILCPIKTCIRRLCDEGHDILTAGDMRSAQSERPVKSTSACVCEVDKAKLTLKVNKIDGFSKLHNVQIDEKTIRVWKSYRIGRGKEISFDQLVTKDQGDTCLIFKEEFSLFMIHVYTKAEILWRRIQMKAIVITIWTIRTFKFLNVWSLGVARVFSCFQNLKRI